MIEAEEIDVEQLMAEIREAVARREAEGRRRSLVGVSFELSGELSADAQAPNAGRAEVPPPLRLQPEFVPAEDDHYHVNDLLQYHDQTFVWNAYRAVLKREPDETGLREFLKLLRAGRLNKMDVLAALRFSVEGQGKGVRVDGLERRPLLRRLYRVPVVGYVLETLAAVARLPAMIRSQRQFETHALAQQELIAARVNQLAQMSFPVMNSLSRELTEVSEGQRESQRRYAELQHQQVVGLFREQRALAERLEKLKAEMDARPDESPRAGGRKPQALTRARLDELFAGFADEFRGPREAVKEGLRFYLPILQEAGVRSDVLDLGCGRGEWLELLKEEGVEARGVETNGALVSEARARKLRVTEEDALEHLRKLEDASLDAVTGFHFIEHLPFESLVELLDEAARILRPGGLVIFETPNPKNLTVGACNFYSDPTHARPLFPETVRFVLGSCGFADVRVEYVNPAGGSPFKDESEASRALDGWFYGPRDFAVVGRKA